MQKKISVLGLCLSCIIMISCAFLSNKGKLACDLDAIKEKAWFQEKVAAHDDFSNENNWYKYIEYNGNAYVVQGSCCTNCRWRPTYYDCEGNEMTIASEDRKPMTDRWKEDAEVVWNGTNCK